MLLTLFTTHQPATDLGYLLHKHPDPAQAFELAIGTAHLFYPEAPALREFALGLEGLERYVAAEPLRRVHECAFALRALESEPVDPRL